jgi:hypothetical protein
MYTIFQELTVLPWYSSPKSRTLMGWELQNAMEEGRSHTQKIKQPLVGTHHNTTDHQSTKPWYMFHIAPCTMEQEKWMCNISAVITTTISGPFYCCSSWYTSIAFKRSQVQSWPFTLIIQKSVSITIMNHLKIRLVNSWNAVYIKYASYNGQYPTLCSHN